MGDRGRTPASELKVVSGLPQHMAPPASLTDDQADVWQDAVRSMEPGFFKNEHRPSLEAYSRHVIRERELSALLQTLDPLADKDDYKQIRDWVDKESAKILAHMRSLRLTPQSQYDEKKASRSSKKGKSELWK
jgi:hypothetical protein